MGVERRFVQAASSLVKVEKRAGGKQVIVGYAARFYDIGDPGTEYELMSGLVERIMPGCFDRMLMEKQDVRGLFNHNRDNVLGRLGAGTCRLLIDAKGLRYEIDPPDTQCGRDTVALLEREDVVGSSFSFQIRQGGEKYVPGGTGLPDVRELHDVDVHDVGPVTFPAYGAASAGITDTGRSLEACGLVEVRDAWGVWKKSLEPKVEATPTPKIEEAKLAPQITPGMRMRARMREAEGR